MKRMSVLLGGVMLLVAGLMPFTGKAAVVETGNEAPWNVSLSPGFINFEGDEDVKDGFISGLHVGYDFNERWTVEGILYYAPDLRANRVEENSGALRFDPSWNSTYLLGVAVDGLWHFTRWERLDPYLTLGVGMNHYGHELGTGDQEEFSVRGGAGVMYHFNDEWALRADFRGLLTGSDSEANSIMSAGLCWTPGAHVPAKFMVVGGPLDSDGDGLTDDEEIAIGTDPHNPDTDGDGLTDYEEVKLYLTNPLNPDTDYDGLKDGEEVYKYHTNPLDRDTDKGGVADGHEVIEDGTNPLNPKDDLIMFTLNINFDYDKSIIKPQYFNDLNVVGKTISRDPGSTARFEGHADKQKKSSKIYNDKLSERRAQAVVDYMNAKSGIERNRMTAVGYGFSRPKEPNTDAGNPVNRRVEVYVRPSGHQRATESSVAPFMPIPNPKAASHTNALDAVIQPAK